MDVVDYDSPSALVYGHAIDRQRASTSTYNTEDFTLVAVDQLTLQLPLDAQRQADSHAPPTQLSSDAYKSPTTRSISTNQTMMTATPPIDPSATRQSSRRALTEALRLAQEAVLLDSQNDDPIAAFRAYSRSVTLLGEVMERVIRGDRDGDQRRRSNRAQVAREDEAKRLKNIHDTYAERMRILAHLYTIPDDLPTPPSVFASEPVIRPAPATSVTYIEPPVSSYQNNRDPWEGVSLSSDGEMSSPRTPTLSDRQYGSTDSLTNTIMAAVVPTGATESTRIPLSAHDNSSVHPASVRGSQLPPARPPPSGPPPVRPHVGPSAVQAVPVSLSDTQPSSQSRLDDHIAPPVSSAELKPDLPAANPTVQRVLLSPEEPRLLSFAGGSQSQGPPQNLRRVSKTPDLIPSPESTPRPKLPSFSARPSHFHGPHVYPASDSYRYQNGSGSGNLVNATTAEGTISQRRSKSSLGLQNVQNDNEAHKSASTRLQQSNDNLVAKLPSFIPPVSREVLESSNRLRSSSQPGIRPALVANYSAPTGREGGIRVPFRPAGAPPVNLSGAPVKTGTSLYLSPTQTQTQAPFVPTSPLISRRNSSLPSLPASPLPPPSPQEPIRKPYHLMILLRRTMTSTSGGYITRKLHVPHEVWSQGGAKLANLPEKVKLLEVLCSSIEDLQTASIELCGAEGALGGRAFGSSSLPTRQDMERWLHKIEEWSAVCEGVVSNLGKKLGVGEGFAVKKSSTMTSWSTKFSRSLDKLTSGKNLDSPATYVNGLVRLFQHAQLLDEHSVALSAASSSIYSSQPVDMLTLLEARLKQSSEFFASVVLTFVIRDLSLLLDKYAKKGGQWLSE